MSLKNTSAALPVPLSRGWAEKFGWERGSGMGQQAEGQERPHLQQLGMVFRKVRAPLTFILRRELPHGQGQGLVEAQLLRHQGLADGVLVVGQHAGVAAHLVHKGLQEHGSPALSRAQGALTHHGARHSPGGSSPFSSSTRSWETRAGMGSARPGFTHSGVSPVLGFPPRCSFTSET